MRSVKKGGHEYVEFVSRPAVESLFCGAARYGSGVFPSAFDGSEEREYLEKMKRGDGQARGISLSETCDWWRTLSKNTMRVPTTRMI